MNIDIEEAKIMLINKKSDLNYTKPREYILKALEQQQKAIEERDRVIKELRKENRAYKSSLQDMAVRLENNPLSKCIDNLASQKTTKHRG